METVGLELVIVYSSYVYVIEKVIPSVVLLYVDSSGKECVKYKIYRLHTWMTPEQDHTMKGRGANDQLDSTYQWHMY